MQFETKKEFNRLRCKWRELSKEYEELYATEKIALEEFYSACMNYVKENNLDNPFEKKPEEEIDNNKKIFDEEETKEVFRKAVLKSHPDKNPEACIDLFHEISLAKKDGDLNKLFDGARKLDVKPKDVTVKQVDALNKEVEDLEKKIDEIIFSAHWIWYHSNNKQKPKIIKLILEKNDE